MYGNRFNFKARALLSLSFTILQGCASLPKEGSKKEYTSKVNLKSRYVDGFNVSSVTKAPLRDH